MPLQQAKEEAFHRAWQNLRAASPGWSPPEGVTLTGSGISFPHLGTQVEFDLNQGVFSLPVPLEVGIVLLHALAAGCPPLETGWETQGIPFKSLPGGSIYQGPFTARVIQPLIRLVGEDPARLTPLAQPLGGIPAALGDTAVTLPVMPGVQVCLMAWQGDEEFPPRAGVLFPPSAACLPTEDWVQLAQALVSWLGTPYLLAPQEMAKTQP